MLISLDCETTGGDHWHGNQPFFVTVGLGGDRVRCWQWAVDPLTRRVTIPEAEKQQLRALLTRADRIVGQNIKFDAHALVQCGVLETWPWEKTDELLVAAHLLASNQPKDLTALTLLYLGKDMQPLEDALEKEVQACRRACRSQHGDWRIARDDLPELPSANTKTWKADTWLPATLARYLWEQSAACQVWRTQDQGGAGDPAQQPGWEYRPPECLRPDEAPHPWYTVLPSYAMADAAATLAVWHELWAELQRRNRTAWYEARLKVLPVLYRMEAHGATWSEERMAALEEGYRNDQARAAALCVGIAKSYAYDLVLPRGASNGSLRTFAFDVLHLEHVKNPKARTEAPTLDSKNAIPYYLDTLPYGSRPRRWVEELAAWRKHTTFLNYCAAYRRYGLPLALLPGWRLLHTSINMTGPDTLRCSSSNPNSQNISKQEGRCPRCGGEADLVADCTACAGTGWAYRSPRYAFGPAPGREWWKGDYENIELRIPAYKAEETELIDLFEHPDDAPYYGSEHLLNFSTVYPDLWQQAVARAGWEKAGRWIKKEWGSTWYQRCKNGDFAISYGAVDRPDGLGTADRTFGRPGSHARLKARFAKKERLNQEAIAFARKYGYVETFPDRTVDPYHGYPLLVTRTEFGTVLETVPFNYKVQSTACWAKLKAMVRCAEQLQQWRQEGRGGGGFDGHIIFEVHDELLWDFPYAANQGNLWRARKLQALMEQSGRDIGVPLRVALGYCPVTWAEAEEPQQERRGDLVAARS